MNRQTLADATSLHDGAVPIYVMQEIAGGTKGSERDAEKTADFLLGRLGKSNLIVKLKALQLISFCIREGGPVFADVIREEESEITAYLQYSGPPDPVMGDERYRRIRVASQEVLVCLNDGNLPRRNDPAPANAAPWGAPSNAQQQPSPYSDNSNPPYGQPGGYQASQGPPPATANSGPWGNSSSSASASRPAPYSDSQSNSGPSYGGQPSYGAPQQSSYGGPGGYGQSNDQSSGYGGSGGYGSNANPPHQQSHGLGSWGNASSSSGAPAYGAPKPAAAAGMWTSTGYQKSAPAAPAYGGGSSFASRDNRPTVLVGHNLNFPKPQTYGNSNLVGGISGTGSGAYGNNSNASGFSGAGGFGGNGGGFGGNSGGFGGNTGSTMGGGGFGGAASRPSYADNNMNRMLSGQSSMGFSGGMQAGGDASTKLSKAVEGLKKIGVEAKDRWDRRNMDKSIGASLADHDELNAGPSVMDRAYVQPHMLQQGSGGRDTSGEYERGLIDSLCASVGLARAPPADALKRFVDLAQTLDVQTIGDILLDKLEDAVWQVRLKALHVVLALLESPGSPPYMELFEDNAGVFEELSGDAKPTVASKSTQVLRALGMVDESTPEPVAQRRPSARAVAARSSVPPPQAANEVDFLGFDALTLHPTHQQTAVAPNIYGSPPPAAPAAFAHHQPPRQPEVSLLDGFDPVPTGPAAPFHQQQQQQQQYAQPHHLLSPRQQQQQQQQYGDLLPMSPLQAPQQAPPGPLGDDRSKTLSNFGKDLFTIANSPRGHPTNGDNTNAAVASERSAFNFM